MRYLVKARIKPNCEERLLNAIDRQTLGKGSIAGDEYQHDMKQARVDSTGAATWVETCFCDPPLEEERPYWEKYFELLSVKDGTLAPELPARERDRAMGLLRLRLHGEAGGKAGQPGRLVSGPAAPGILLLIMIMLLILRDRQRNGLAQE